MIDKEIQEKIDEKNGEIALLSAFSPHYEEIKILMSDITDEDGSNPPYSYFYVGGYAPSTHMSMCIRINGESWREAFPLISKLRLLGYAIDRNDAGSAMHKTTGGFEWGMSKKTEYTNNLELESFQIRVQVVLSVIANDEEDATVCRRVQVGTETVQKPVYKLVCPEGEEDLV